MFYNRSDTLEEVRRCLPDRNPAALPGTDLQSCHGATTRDPRCVRLKERIADAVLLAYQEGYRHFLCGMAQGCDLYFCEAVLALRERYPEVTVEAAIPCPTQADAWPEAERDRYRELVARCDMETMVSDTYSSTCMQRRDRYMVDHAMLLIAAFDGTAGGTRYTVEYALRRGIEIFDVSIPTE